MLNLGPPPPPPPPPFATGTPSPPRRPPTETLVKPALPIATPPAALAGAMLKDKKPFTYTPGGFNLADIKSPRMQRRLQRNACMEGVRPSPLAQQSPPPSPGGVSTTLPPHGMIQVLPVPGMGMGPVVKPQSPKEPPKPKKKVCGPPPPPPPFTIGESSSINTSSTPTTASVSAITSVTPPTTPSASSSPFSSLPLSPMESEARNGWDNGHSLSDHSNLKPLVATEPALIVQSHIPPPPPPSSFSPAKKIFPSTPSSSVSKSDLPSSLSPAPSSVPKSSNSSNPDEDKEICQDQKTQAVSSVSLSEERKSIPEACQEDVHPALSQESKLDLESKDATVLLSPKEQTNSETEQTVSKETSENVNGLASNVHEEQNEQKEANINEINICDTDTIVNMVQNENKEKDKAMNTHTNDEMIDKTEPISQDTKPNEKQSPSGGSELIKHSKTLIKAPEDEIIVNNKVPESKEQELPPKIIHHKEDNEIKLDRETSLNPPETITSDSAREVKSPKQPPVFQTKHQQHQINHPTKDLSSKNLTMKSMHGANKSETDNPCTFRPGIRMASPPVGTERENKVPNPDRFIRQASLPAEPLSPGSGSKQGERSSFYTPQRKQSNGDRNGIVKTPPFQNSNNNSPTSISGLNKGPLPWMCGIKKEQSPPPEFLIHAQKTQERLQRQRSITQKDIHKQPPYNQQNNKTDANSSLPQNALPSSSSISAPTFDNLSNLPQISQNTNSTPHHTWRSSIHKTTPTNYQQRPHEQPQKNFHQHQNLSQNSSQSFNHQRVPTAFPIQKIQSNTLPRERIIPIRLEESQVTPTSKDTPFLVKDFTPTKVNPYFQTNTHQRKGSWPSRLPTIGNSGAFSPYESQEKCHSSSNALEALQQMQQNLAQLNSGLQTTQNGAQPNGTHHLNEPAVTQSRSFKVLQSTFDNHDSTGTPTMHQQDAPPEVKKYTGSSIPSRSFRMLQAMTDDDEGDTKTASLQGKAWASEENVTTSSLPNSTSSQSSSSFLPSFQKNSAQFPSATSSHATPSPSLSLGASSASSRKKQQQQQQQQQQHPPNSNEYRGQHCSIKSPEYHLEVGVSPSYTNTTDSPVYRHVIPKLVSSSQAKDERVVNSALSTKRDSSPRPWNKSVARSDSCQGTSIASKKSTDSQSGPGKRMNPSPVNSRRIDSSSLHPGNEHSTEPNDRRLYGGSSIPSRVFQQLRNDYSDNYDDVTFNDSNLRSSRSMTPSSPRVTEVYIPRIMQQLNLDQGNHCHNDKNDSEGDHYRNGILETASAKESVLKELTSQFDPQTNLKKPKAAPGRVFRYLQQQYDDPQDSDFTSMDSLSNYQSSNDNSSQSNACLSPSTSSGIDCGHYEIEPKPYDGGRIPGRTFRLLQENIGTHPSVLQARK